MAANTLVEVPRTDLRQLRDLFTLDWPRHIIGFDLVNNYVHWYEQESDYGDAKIYSMNGDWSEGTFIILVSLTVHVRDLLLTLIFVCLAGQTSLVCLLVDRQPRQADANGATTPLRPALSLQHDTEEVHPSAEGRI